MSPLHARLIHLASLGLLCLAAGCPDTMQFTLLERNYHGNAVANADEQDDVGRTVGDTGSAGPVFGWADGTGGTDPDDRGQQSGGNSAGHAGEGVGLTEILVGSGMLAAVAQAVTMYVRRRRRQRA